MKINTYSIQSYISDSSGYERVKIYKIWKGKNYFLFKGKIFVSSNFYFGIFTNLYIHIFSWLFIKYVIMVNNILCNIEIRQRTKNSFNNNRIYIIFTFINKSIYLCFF